ncbi:hypothetical protein K456DRAFT_1077455 [Colletotrichum gloeosporioides 23]|nr:hypothetical protein K456DRAFT_1077455 [Colletotrichum gloeosporioides 23]
MAVVKAAERVDVAADDLFSQQPSRKITLILSGLGFDSGSVHFLFHFFFCLFAFCLRSDRFGLVLLLWGGTQGHKKGIPFYHKRPIVICYNHVQLERATKALQTCVSRS